MWELNVVWHSSSLQSSSFRFLKREGSLPLYDLWAFGPLVEKQELEMRHLGLMGI